MDAVEKRARDRVHEMRIAINREVDVLLELETRRFKACVHVWRRERVGWEREWWCARCGFDSSGPTRALPRL